jgi:hypothetical protein
MFAGKRSASGPAVRLASPEFPESRRHKATTGHKFAATDAGAVDVLGSINDSLLYDNLIGSSDELGVTGQRLKVLSPSGPVPRE